MLLVLAALACTDPVEDPGGLLGLGPMWPFPSAHLVGEDGRLAIPSGLLPQVPEEDGGTAWPVERLNWRAGFSPIQSSVVLLPGVIEAALPPITGTVGGGSVRMFDLTDGREWPCFAELDAHPDAPEDERTLIVRPMQAMPFGHQMAVVVTTAAAPRPARFDALLRGGDEVPPSLEGWRNHYRGLVASLGALGVQEQDIALAWDFPVGDGTAPLRQMVADLEPTRGYAFYDQDDVDEGDRLPTGTWRRAEGYFITTSWLTEELYWGELDGHLPQITGTTEADLFVLIPESVRDAEPGTVPVLVFGHGLLTDPQTFLAQSGDPHGFIDLMDRLGVIVVATTWRGVTTKDLAEAVWVANDYGTFYQLSERLTQGVANVVGLFELVQDGDLLEDPIFGGLADRTRVSYYGVSAGAILGSAMLSLNERPERAVLHVVGSSWATLLERSSVWPQFEGLIEQGIPDPAQRQLGYAASQLLWDMVDPMSYTAELSQRTLLLQEAYNDEVVPNLVTENLARSLEIPILQPSTTIPFGLGTVSGSTRNAALAQYDPGLTPPEPVNRPPADTGAHVTPRLWESAKVQAVRFFDAGDPGVIAHFCGDEPCNAQNTEVE